MSDNFRYSRDDALLLVQAMNKFETEMNNVFNSLCCSVTYPARWNDRKYKEFHEIMKILGADYINGVNVVRDYRTHLKIRIEDMG